MTHPEFLSDRLAELIIHKKEVYTSSSYPGDSFVYMYWQTSINLGDLLLTKQTHYPCAFYWRNTTVS